ncbi:MAG: TetR family transcriptional regulator [Actinomycetota bacterium]|nr:MAG: TetR family transcriptional regulator [Actinomycetota bacterium]
MAERFIERSRGERSRALARTTAQLLREEGCFRVKVEAVARAAGVGKGTVYLDHGDKVGLVGSSLELACRDLVAAIDRAVAGASDPRARLARAVEVLVRACSERPELAVVLERRLPCAARWLGADLRPYARLVARLRLAVAEAIGGRPGPEAGLVAEALLGTLSMPGWQDLARRRPREAVRSLTRIVPAPTVHPG